MQIVNIDEFMKMKLIECETWLNGKDEAVAKLAEAEEAYNKARVAVEEYTDSNIIAVNDYKAQLEDRLGIVKEQPIGY